MVWERQSERLHDFGAKMVSEIVPFSGTKTAQNLGGGPGTPRKLLKTNGAVVAELADAPA
jgi:hypothetical protein